MHLSCSYLVPFAFRRAGWLCRGVARFAALLQFLADHPDFEEEAARFDALANTFQLRRGYLLRTVRDVEKNALKLIQYTAERGISLFHSGLAIAPIFLHQAFAPTLLPRDLPLLLSPTLPAAL